MVLFVFREDYYVAAREPKRPIEGDDVKIHAAHEEWAGEMDRVYGLAELIVGKSRHGSTGKVRLHFDAKTTKYSDLADDCQAYDDNECSLAIPALSGLSFAVVRTPERLPNCRDRQRVVEGTSVSVRVDMGGGPFIKNKNN